MLVLTRLTQVLLLLIFVVVLLALLTLPWMLDTYLAWTRDAFAQAPGYRWFITVFLALSGCIGLWIVAELYRVLRTIDGNPFVRRNVTALMRMGGAAFALAALFFAKCIAYMTPMTIATAAVLLMCGLFAFVLSGVFAQAVRYKEENDLTI